MTNKLKNPAASCGESSIPLEKKHTYCRSLSPKHHDYDCIQHYRSRRVSEPPGNALAVGFILSIFLLHPGIAFCANAPSFDYSFIVNQLKMGAANHVEFQQVSDTPVTYRAWGVWNFAHPAKTIAEIAVDFAGYPKVFRHVYRCDRITGPPQRGGRFGTWYVEGRAAIARVWAIGDIDTLGWKDSSQLRFIAHQNEDQELESKWSYMEKGWLNYRTRGVHLAAFIVASGHDSCRVGIVAQGWVKNPMPTWLIRMATGLILPQILADLEKEASRRTVVQKPRKDPWYKRWLKDIRWFLF